MPIWELSIDNTGNIIVEQVPSSFKNSSKNLHSDLDIHALQRQLAVLQWTWNITKERVYELLNNFDTKIIPEYLKIYNTFIQSALPEDIQKILYNPTEIQWQQQNS